VTCSCEVCRRLATAEERRDTKQALSPGHTPPAGRKLLDHLPPGPPSLSKFLRGQIGRNFGDNDA